MPRRIYQVSLLFGLLALAACSGKPTNSAAITPTPTATFTPTATPTPTPTSPRGFVLYTSADHIYQIAYPSGWQIVGTTGAHAMAVFTGPGQIFEVSELGHSPGGTPAQIINNFCQARQQGVAANPVKTSSVTIGGQSWTRANCDAGAQSPAIELIVEVIVYQGATYQIDYMSPIVEFSRDNKSYYALMEKSFTFLR